MMVQLSVIIVNWNSKDFIHRCVASVLAYTTDLDYEIIVVDSGSFDGCGEVLRDCYPQVRFLQLKENVGFARANNIAFDVSTGESVLFLNPDTEVVGPAINTLYSTLHRLPYAGVVGGKLLNSDRTVQMSSIKAFPNLLNQILDANALQKLFPRARVWGMRPLFDTTDTPAEVDVISGACMIMHRSVYENVGEMSTHYFIYSEDVDLCLKTTRAGLKNYYVPSAVILHHGGGCTAAETATNFSNVMALESRWRFFSKTKSQAYGWLYRVEVGFLSAVRLSLLVICWAFHLFVRRPAPKIRVSFKKWWAGLRWTMGLEGWVKSY